MRSNILVTCPFSLAALYLLGVQPLTQSGWPLNEIAKSALNGSNITPVL